MTSKENSNNGSNGRSGGRSNRKARRGGAAAAGRVLHIVTAPVRSGRSDQSARAKGVLLIIGGHEDRTGDKLILRHLAERVGSGKLVVMTAASQVPDEVYGEYEPLFRGLGVKHVARLDVESRQEAKSERKLRALDEATAVFFTGGDQLKLTSQLGDTPIYERVREIYLRGGTIAGTSAGASVVCETMLVSGNGTESPKVRSSLRMAPGFGLIQGVIIDQHFAERGRIGRLLAAVAQNPRILGIGIDEDTAIVCEPDGRFRVLGSGAVCVADGADVTYSNLAEEDPDRVLSVFGVRLFQLSMGDEFDLATRTATSRPADEVEEELVEEGG
ncbi:MAG: cyanophycinase [Gemmatimonadaceae bacterium]